MRAPSQKDSKPMNNLKMAQVLRSRAATISSSMISMEAGSINTPTTIIKMDSLRMNPNTQMMMTILVTDQEAGVSSIMTTMNMRDSLAPPVMLNKSSRRDKLARTF